MDLKIDAQEKKSWGSTGLKLHFAGKCNFPGYSAHNLIGLISAFPWVFGSCVSILVD